LIVNLALLNVNLKAVSPLAFGNTAGAFDIIQNINTNGQKILTTKERNKLKSRNRLTDFRDLIPSVKRFGNWIAIERELMKYTVPPEPLNAKALDG